MKGILSILLVLSYSLRNTLAGAIFSGWGEGHSYAIASMK